MSIGIIVIILIALIVMIWAIMEAKRLRKRLLAIFLIGLVLFAAFTIFFAFKGKQADLKSFSGITDAVKVYFSWYKIFFSNMRTLTGNVVNMNWKGNSTGMTS